MELISEGRFDEVSAESCLRASTSLVSDPVVERFGNCGGSKAVFGDDAACTIFQQLRLEFRVLLAGQGQDRHFGGRNEALHGFPAAGIRQIEVRKNHVHRMLTEQGKSLGDTFGMNELNPGIAELGEPFPKQENIHRVVFDQQEANGFGIAHYGGKVTFLNQNVSIVCTISLNLLKSTGFAR